MSINQLVSSPFSTVFLLAVVPFFSSACASSSPVRINGTAEPEVVIEIKRLKLAQAGDASAQNDLGVLYYEARNYRKAREWFDKAVEKGHAEAQVNLGTLYLHGEGATQSNEMAFFWFERGAKQENALAFAKLALMYAHGRGVRQDFIQAYKLYDLSIAHGELRSAEARDALAKNMTPAQISEAERLARESTRRAPESAKTSY